MATPHDVLLQSLDELELLRAMYPAELQIDQPIEELLSALRHCCEDETLPLSKIPPSITIALSLTVGEVSPLRSILLFIELLTPHDTSDSQGLRLRVRQPEWLTKAEAAALTEDIPGDIFTAIEHVHECATAMLAKKSDASHGETSTHHGPLVRVWFYFPSISTREKRDDIVRFAPGYKLTGFLLAGKPGILCLEGDAQDIDEYMKYIKSVSWSDIPSHHKKVSERYRESGAGITRMFRDMTEITDLLEKRGERSNRGDMKALEAWLADKGLANAFSQVLL